MTSKSHKKHTHLTKPKGGLFGQQEFAFLGAPRNVIQNLCNQLATHLKTDYALGYADASHQNETTPSAFKTSYIDLINHHGVHFKQDYISTHFRAFFNSCDLVLVNGNHFLAKSQIVIVNEQKKVSLEKKLERLTDVKIFILDNGVKDLFPFLKEHIKNYKDIPLFPINDVNGIGKTIKKIIGDCSVPIKGLVLAGGNSTRMGHDKGAIKYHGKAHREYLADLLNNFCSNTYLSVQNESINLKTQYSTIPDSFLNLGPYGGILSAFKKDPNSAWLVVATDLPLLDANTLNDLMKGRDKSKMATCFHNPETAFPEPLLTLWEPRAYPILLQFLAYGYSCPRKVLINSEIRELPIKNTDALRNVNTPEEFKVLTMLDKP